MILTWHIEEWYTSQQCHRGSEIRCRQAELAAETIEHTDDEKEGRDLHASHGEGVQKDVAYQ